MGLTLESVSKNAADLKTEAKKSAENDIVVALAGNPNVGKSTVFNALTGMRRHTGNWPGKTVTNATGYVKFENKNYIIADIPGTYSLAACSKEEEVARDFICFSNPDAVAVVCDASCLERNLNLVLQVLEITKNVVVCVNLLDEAKRKNIKVNLKKLSSLLGVCVVGMCARKGEGMEQMLKSVRKCTLKSEETVDEKRAKKTCEILYPSEVEKGLSIIQTTLAAKFSDKNINIRWLALKLAENDTKSIEAAEKHLKIRLSDDVQIKQATETAEKIIGGDKPISDKIAETIAAKSKEIFEKTVLLAPKRDFDKKADKILTGRVSGMCTMLMLLGVVFWLTVSGANIISDFLSDIFLHTEDIFVDFFVKIGVANSVYEPLVFGVWRVTYWVVSVMLPPMAIFFPLFTLLEDLGYLPRIAFNLDNSFEKCNACGKQALTMCMGFGCNAAGVVGCRIINSPRERLIAVITNSFVPCNGRIPILILVASMFFGGKAGGLAGAAALTAAVVIGVIFTLVVSKLLSLTILKGEKSAFVLELPPYRKPQIGSVIVRSMLDRTFFVLKRAVAVAAPAGLAIWILANVNAGGVSMLLKISGALNPVGKLLGMDGTILLAFILAFPANELVIPLAVMMYMSDKTISALPDMFTIRDLFVSNGWDVWTAVCVMLFSLMHWPCSTTLLTIKKETGSLKWTLAAFLIPTLCGIVMCLLVNSVKICF